jgi:DNA (cytosine-5)-methyltransferase 1
MNLTAIDLFCGCGGISEGLRSAGFKIVAAADNNPKYSITYKKNFPDAKFVGDSIAEISPEEFCSLVKIKPNELDLLAGGPPCQGFSKNVPRSQREIDSKNNLLVNTFLNYCEALSPRAVLMENVAEMRNGFGKTYTHNILERLHNAGYSVSESVINAADYGVPQMRRRAFFVALKGNVDKFVFPVARFANKADMFTEPHRVVADAISDLPKLKDGEGAEEMDYEAPDKNLYQKEMRNGSLKVWNHLTRKLAQKQFTRLSLLQPGQGIKELPADLRPKGGYSGAYGRLTWNMVAPTITRWVFHPGSGRWGHPDDIRILTTRETARLQSFPDKFKFYGSFNDMAGQLGNAVPPIVSKTLGECIRKRLLS